MSIELQSYLTDIAANFIIIVILVLLINGVKHWWSDRQARIEREKNPDNKIIHY